MPRWLSAMLVFAPLSVVGRLVGAPDVVVFGAACLGLVPLAGLIGLATGHVAHHLGPQYGGLLNATFGNAVELIITLFALRQGLFTLAKAAITGSIVGNTLLVLGRTAARRRRAAWAAQVQRTPGQPQRGVDDPGRRRPGLTRAVFQPGTRQRANRGDERARRRHSARFVLRLSRLRARR